MKAIRVAKDDIATVVAIGALSYVTADVAHHALGHGAACLVLGGRIASLSSTYVDCTVRGSAVDLAGPLASFLVGMAALLWLRLGRRLSAACRLFCILVAAFDLFWCALQLAFSAATRTDDWAWAMHEFHAGSATRIALVVTGLAGYAWTVRACGARMAPFASPGGRARRIAIAAWAAAGVIACATILFDRHWPLGESLRRALAQALGLSFGLLLLPRAARLAPSASDAEAIRASWSWIVAGVAAAAASVLLLGPGIAIP
jgi:hypothetical protein